MEDRIYPVIQTVMFGANLEMECLSEERVYWLKDGRRLTSTQEYQNHILKLKYVAMADGGLYECHGSINSGEDKFVSKALVLIQGKTLRSRRSDLLPMLRILVYKICIGTFRSSNLDLVRHSILYC